jgi:hypothetical protein
MRFYFLLLLLFTGRVFADSAWYNPLTGEDVFYKDEHQACEAVLPQVLNHLNSPGPYSFVIDQVSAGYGPCAYRYTRNDGSKGVTNVTIDGVNSASYPAHECTANEPDEVSWPFGVKDSPTGDVPAGSAIVPPALICSKGCVLDRGPVKSCYAFTEDDPLKVYCDWSATQTGESCATADEPPRPELPDGPADPCETNPSGPGCTDGGGDGGDGGDNGGGDGNGDGSSGGDGDSGNGDGTNPGDGNGDNGGGDSSNPGGSVSGIECDQGLLCSGDAIQCAILEVQNRARCASLNAGDFTSQEGDISGLIDGKGEAATLDEGTGDVDVAGLFTDSTKSRFLPSNGCPPPKTVSLASAGGRVFELSFQPLCDFASDLSYFIVIAASIFYAVYVGRSFGGE